MHWWKLIIVCMAILCLIGSQCGWQHSTLNSTYVKCTAISFSVPLPSLLPYLVKLFANHSTVSANGHQWSWPSFDRHQSSRIIPLNAAASVAFYSSLRRMLSSRELLSINTTYYQSKLKACRRGCRWSVKWLRRQGKAGQKMANGFVLGFYGSSAASAMSMTLVVFLR